MRFEYLQRIVVDGELEVENIGQCVLQANDDFAKEYYLIIKTELGYTEIIEYGPLTPDIQLLCDNYQIKYQRFEYNQGKIERIIDKFLNDGKRGITQAKVTTLEEIKSFLVNPVDVIDKERLLFND